MTSTLQLGLMVSDPSTGECFAAYATELPSDERAAFIIGPALLERKTLPEVKAAFGETHPSRQIEEYGPAIGQFDGKAIPEWVKTADGARHVYGGVCSLLESSEKVEPGCFVLAPGFVFQPTI